MLESRRLRLVLIAIVAIVAIAVYANSLANGFAYDDDFIIKDRPLVHGLDRVGELLVSPYWPQEFSAGLYRPLTSLTYALGWEVWGGRPFGFHLVNVLLHAAVSVLVLVFLLRFFPWWGALLGGLVFAVHSLHTEAVANVVGRAEILMALFALAACLVYMRAVRGPGLGWRSGLAIVALYLLACFSKEMGVVIPGLLLATDLPLVRDRKAGDLRRFVCERWPLFVALAGSLVLVFGARWVALGAALEHQPDRAFALDSSFPTRLFTMARVWPRYFELFFFPLDLSADYSPSVILPVDQLTPLGLAGFALVFSVFICALLLLRRLPELTMAVVWVALSILPVSNLLIMVEIVLAERTLYLATVAVSVFVALIVTHAAASRRRFLVAATAIWIAGFSAVTIQRNPVWESTDSVFENLRRRHPESSRLLFGIASMYLRDGDWRRAEQWFDKSIEVWPHHAPYRAEYALYLFQHGKLEKAESMVAGAVALRPEGLDYHVLLAAIRLQAGDFEAASDAARRGLSEAGESPQLYSILVEAHAARGEYEAAIRVQNRVMELREHGPTWRDHLRLAELLHAAGSTAAARESLDRARAAPDARIDVLEALRQRWEAEGPADAGPIGGQEN